MADATSSRPYSSRIITPEMVPPDPGPFEMQAGRHTSRAQRLEQLYQRAMSANTQREDAAQSPGFDVAHEVNREWAADISRGACWHRGAAELFTNMASVFGDVRTAHENIDVAAHQEIAAATTPLEREGIVAVNNTFARAVAANGVEMMGAHYTFFQTNYGSDYTALARVLGGIAQNPIPATPNPGTGIGVPVKNTKVKGGKADSGPADQAASGGNSAQSPPGTPGAVPAGARPAGTPDGIAEPNDSEPSPARLPWAAPANTLPRASMPAEPSPLSGMPGGMGGGLPSGGLPTGMLGGLGGGSPLSGLTSGLGQVSGAAPPGLGNVPAAAENVPNAAAQVAQASQPSAEFAKGLASAAGAGGAGLPPVAPATAAPSSVGDASAPAAAAASASAPPAAAAAGSVPSSAPMTAGAAHAAAAAAAPAGPAPMLLPPPPMGSPAAPGDGPVAMPAGSSSGSASTPASPALTPAAASSAGPTLVPAGVVNPVGSTSRPKRAESPDLAAATALVWQLLNASDSVQYAIDWAVGVFRSPEGTETVVMSNEGSGYVPAGVFLPRSARLMVADPLVSRAFRDRWFGWLDPARVLVEYASLRADSGWNLVAAATTGPLDALRAARVEYTECIRDRSPLVAQTPPGLDGMHVHRLQLEHADVYDRLELLADAKPVYRERVILPISRAMMSAVQSQGYPVELRAVWTTLTAGNEPTATVWTAYDDMTRRFYREVGAKRPGLTATSPEDAPDLGYGWEWLTARTLEHIGGWAGRPLPLADMVYAAAAVGTVNVRQELVPVLKAIEDELMTNR